MYLLPGRYFGIEPEEWLVEEGTKAQVGSDLVALKKPTFSNESGFQLSLFGESFDYLMAQSIFSHASRQQIRTCLKEARKVMKPTSIFAATFILGNDDYEGDDWVYPGCVKFTQETIVRMAEEQGLACVPTIWPHLYDQTWFVITDPANLDNVPPLSDAASIAILHKQLAACESELGALKGHPYVKFGMGLKRLLGR